MDIKKIMQSPEFWGKGKRDIKVVETHISTVFLVGDRVYKIKKPVDFGFLDYSSYEKREENIVRELKLNQRLSPDIYEGITYLVEKNGTYLLSKDGRRVEPVLVMKRLKDEDLLATKIRALTTEQKRSLLSKLGRKIACFHRGAEGGEYIERFGDIKTIRISIEENFNQTIDFISKTIDKDIYDAIKEYSYDFLERESVFINRKKKGRIRDCHGDLHLKQIYADDSKIWVTDCIEFNERFRFIDTASDIAFLVMDCIYRSSINDAFLLLNSYLSIEPDISLPEVLRFYLVYRAYVRGKVNSFIWSDTKKTSVLEEAKGYFDLAYNLIKREKRPVLFLMCGPSRSGKSTLADEISYRFPSLIYRSDSIRKDLFGFTPITSVPDEFKEMVYSSPVSDRVYKKLLKAVQNSLSEGWSVVADATFIKRRHRQRFIEVAKSLGTGVIIVYMDIDEKEAMIRSTKKRYYDTSDGDYEIFLKQKELIEPPSVDEGSPVVRITHDITPELAADLVLREAGVV